MMTATDLRTVTCEWCRNTVDLDQSRVVRERGKALTMCPECAPTDAGGTETNAGP